MRCSATVIAVHGHERDEEPDDDITLVPVLLKDAELVVNE